VRAATLVNDCGSHMYMAERETTPADVKAKVPGMHRLGRARDFLSESVNLAIGNKFNSPQGAPIDRLTVSDKVTWQKKRKNTNR